MEEKVRFGLFTDLHLDIMHDGERRLDSFINEMKEKNVDFIIQLGDFCYPEDTSYCRCSRENIPVNLKNSMEIPTDVPKTRLLKQFNAFPKPSYHVLGNHEFDFSSKKAAMKLYGMENNYYSFECKGWKFIVLDANFYKGEDGKYHDFSYGDYFDHKELPYIDGCQMKWLEKELKNTDLPVIIFSHQPLHGGIRGLKNAAELEEMFKTVNSKEKKIYMCINGHIHVDNMIRKDGIYYYTVNSISGHWIGPEYECVRFSDEIEAKYPNLKYTFPYGEPLYITVELDKTGARIEGKKGSFIPPGPERWKELTNITASIEDRNIRW